MMYVGGAPWHGLGAALDKPATAEEAIQAARLDWMVKKLPLFASDGENSLLRLPVPDKFAVARENSLDVLGVVGSSYTPVQNREAFAFFDPIVGTQAAIYHTAGALGKGERVWILAKLPDSIRVVGDDITDKFLLLTNSHDGTSSLQVKFTPVRVVCQNTLSLALNQGGAGIKISHHTEIHKRMRAAERMLGLVHHHFDELAETFREMVRVPMSGNRLEKYLEYVYPDPKDRLPTESEAECIARDCSWSEYFFDQGAGNRMIGVRGTLWAAYNGVTEWLDHRKIRQSADQRLASIWYGEANRIKARALTVAVEMLPHFRN
jgi:phage/plasmid-like protein (TIGR03299 family)